MAVGQLLLTYPSRHTHMHPLPNKYLHGAVLAGIAIQFAAASSPLFADLLGNAGIPIELWGLVFVAAFLSWGLAEVFSRLAWRKRTAGDRSID
jgi:Ca2+-transporting ATPase